VFTNRHVSATPLPKPDVQVSLHPAFHPSVILALHLMTRLAQRLQIAQKRCRRRSLESPNWLDVVNFRLRIKELAPAMGASPVIPDKTGQTGVRRTGTLFMARPHERRLK